ncbi:MAG: DUF72 domain-containing protein [Deltaproteobacteria bacterium]|nr:DUF72 domain-containing protein [Deltaproteobacteria bacterium]
MTLLKLHPSESTKSVSLLVGTYGYSYPEWVDAGIYPPGTKSARMLPLYARDFAVTELNYTWYQMPRAEAIERQRAFHAIVSDGVWIQNGANGKPKFYSLPAPSKEELTKVSYETCENTVKLLKKIGLWHDEDTGDDIGEDRFQIYRRAIASSAVGLYLYCNNLHL